jgi:hypothetical protein
MAFDVSSSSKFEKYGLIILSIPLVLILVVIGAIYLHYFSFEHFEKPRILGNFEKQLEKKYGTKFVVEDLECNNSGLGSVCSWSAQAHSVDDSSSKFSVGADNEVVIVYDQYRTIEWKNKEKPILQSLTSSIYGELKPEVEVNLILSGNLITSITRDSPTYEEAIVKYPDYLLYELTVKSDTDTTNMLESERKAIQLAQAVNSRGFKNILLKYTGTINNISYVCENRLKEELSVNIFDSCENKSSTLKFFNLS